MSLKDQRVLLGVTGSIAAYKACDLVQRLKEKGASVRVTMTENAARMVHPNTFAALTGHPVAMDAWADAGRGAMTHIDNARWATIFLVAPCTAHTLAELSLGFTGSIVSMTALAYRGPMLIAPAMNTVMLGSDPVREHIRRLQARGIPVLPTSSGVLACGEEGEGKLITPEEIVAYADLFLGYGYAIPRLEGIRILISGGHTEENLDGVRFLSNRSSGKTAAAMVRAFLLAGAQVHLVWGMADVPAPPGAKVTRIRTSAEFLERMRAGQKDADAVIMAAAIADFIPDSETGKWKDSKSLKKIELRRAPNILGELGQGKRKGQLLVGFALETDQPVTRAREKLAARNCDLIVVNNPLARAGLGFGEDGVEAAILDARGPAIKSERLSVMEKNGLAAELVRRVAAKLKRKTSA